MVRPLRTEDNQDFAVPQLDDARLEGLEVDTFFDDFWTHWAHSSTATLWGHFLVVWSLRFQ